MARLEAFRQVRDAIEGQLKSWVEEQPTAKAEG
jgi:hypothetical protein